MPKENHYCNVAARKSEGSKPLTQRTVKKGAFIMEQVIKFQAELADKYGYKPLPADESAVCRELYRRTVPSFLAIEGASRNLYNFSGTLIATGYERIVIGDYGAFVEFSQEQAVPEAYIVKSGEEYRLTDRYGSTVKYEWLTTRDYSDVKIYHQRRTVLYADYRPGYFYVSVFEVFIHGDELDSTGF